MAATVHIETLSNPLSYSEQQLKRAIDIARALGRGKLVLCEEPRR